MASAVSIEAVKILGTVFATIPLFAGLSVWFTAGMIHAAWKDSQIRATRVTGPTPFSKMLGPIALIILVSFALHAIGWALRSLVVRRERAVGMRSGFWTVLYSTAYTVGFLGGALCYFAL